MVAPILSSRAIAGKESVIASRAFFISERRRETCPPHNVKTAAPRIMPARSFVKAVETLSRRQRHCRLIHNRVRLTGTTRGQISHHPAIINRQCLLLYLRPSSMCPFKLIAVDGAARHIHRRLLER